MRKNTHVQLLVKSELWKQSEKFLFSQPDMATVNRTEPSISEATGETLASLEISATAVTPHIKQMNFYKSGFHKSIHLHNHTA